MLAVPSTRPAARRLWAAAAGLCVAALIAGVLPSVQPGAGWDNQVKIQVAENILDGAGPVLLRPTPWDQGYVVPGRNGQRVSGFPLLASVIHFVTIAWARAGGPVTASVPSALLLALTAWALVAWGRRSGASPPAAAAGALLVCLGTALWPMASFGYDNLVEVVTLAMLLWVGAGEPRAREWSWAGLILGLACATRLSAALLAVPAVVLLAAQAPRTLRDVVRRAVALAAGGVPGLAIIVWFNWYRFGAPFLVRYHVPSAFSATTDMSVPWFSRHHWEGMAGLIASPGKGIIWYGTPLIGVLLLAGPLARRHRAAAIALAAYLLSAVLVIGRFKYWHGDWNYGPRLVAPVYVAIAPLVWWAWDGWVARGRLHVRAASIGALALFSVVQAFPVTVFPPYAVQKYVLAPESRAGNLVTRFPEPPDPADNEIFYFRVRTSPLWAMGLQISDLLQDPRSARRLRDDLALALLAPVLAAAALAIVDALERRHAATERTRTPAA